MVSNHHSVRAHPLKSNHSQWLVGCGKLPFPPTTDPPRYHHNHPFFTHHTPRCCITRIVRIASMASIEVQERGRVSGSPDVATQSQNLNRAEVARHNTSDSVWCTIDHSVYDLTKFLDFHPGGSRAIMQYAGKDITEVFYSLHKTSVLNKVQSQHHHVSTSTYENSCLSVSLCVFVCVCVPI
jgi:cytochrome b involved in lipid metabolism